MKKLILAILCLLVTNFAFAGGNGSGGGQGIVCRNDDGTVASAELLDLAEAQGYYLLKLSPQPASRPYIDIAREYASILDNAIPSSDPISNGTKTDGSQVSVSQEIDPSIILSHMNHDDYVLSSVNEIDKDKMLIPGNNYKIPPVSDSHPRILPSGKRCDLEQIAVYTDGNNQVHFVGAIWKKLNNINKAALLVHEALYRNLRMMGDKFSDQTRKAVGYLFSGMKFNWVLDGLPQKYLSCWTTDPRDPTKSSAFEFVVYPGSDNFVTADFLVFNNEVMLTRTAVNLDIAPFAAAFGRPAPKPQNLVVAQTIENPLPDVSNLAFSINVDSTTGKLSSSLEASGDSFGDNPQAIQCNDHLSSIVIGADGSVAIGPANP